MPTETTELVSKEAAATATATKEEAPLPLGVDAPALPPVWHTAADPADEGGKPTAAALASEGTSPEPTSGANKCACANNKCLKLYCECLRKGQYCNDECDCHDCHNTTDEDGEGGMRLEAIRYIFQRRPDALTEEMKVMALGGGWEPPAKPQKKSPFPKKSKSAKKTPVKSAAGKTVAKAKNARAKTVAVGKLDDSESSEDETADAIPYSAEEFPQLMLDGNKDCSELATSFTRPLFKEPSRPLEIAYSQHLAAKNLRKQAQRKKNAILQEYNQLREKFQQKKLELSLANDEVKGHSQTVGAWTRKVFDLELEEPCSWNANYEKLKAYKEEHGKLPPNAKKAKDEEQRLSLWLDRIRGLKNQEEREEEEEETPKKKRNKNKKYVRDYPHRLESLANLGVVWENYNDNRWEIMFQKLLIYKEEQGTLRFPSDDQCAATGDEELIALQKWVKSQVLTFRYGKKKNPELIKRLVDIGFDFEKWFAKPGKMKKAKAEKVLEVNNYIEETVAEDDGRKMPAEVVEDAEMKVGASAVV